MVQNQSPIGPSYRLPLVGPEALVDRTQNSMMTSFRRLLSFADCFQNARALVKRFSRDEGIYRSDVSSPLLPLARVPVSGRAGARV